VVGLVFFEEVDVLLLLAVVGEALEAMSLLVGVTLEVPEVMARLSGVMLPLVAAMLPMVAAMVLGLVARLRLSPAMLKWILLAA
jgi:hypothetical protein